MVGLTWNVCGAVTFSVTGTSIGLPAAPVDVIVTLPRYCPGAREPEFTDTWTAEFVAALAGVAESQLPPLSVDAEVAWAGFANRELAEQVGPVLREALRAHGMLG